MARKHAGDQGVADRVSFEVASASTFSGTGYDLVATFDCLHDMGDPLAAARHVRQALKPDGTWLIVEPAAADDVAGNMNPVGPGLLQLLHAAVRAERAVPVRRLRARRAGRRGRHQAGHHRRRLHPVPARRRDPVQPRLRSPSLAGPGASPLAGWAVSTSWQLIRPGGEGDALTCAPMSPPFPRRHITLPHRAAERRKPGHGARLLVASPSPNVAKGGLLTWRK